MTFENDLADAQKNGIDKYAVGAILFQDDAVLLLRRSKNETFLPGLMELPGGGVEKTETIIEALDRELQEEAGITSGDWEYLNFFDYQSESDNITRQFNFFSFHFSGNVFLNKIEHDLSLWQKIKPCPHHDFGVSGKVLDTLKLFSQRL